MSIYLQICLDINISCVFRGVYGGRYGGKVWGFGFFLGPWGPPVVKIGKQGPHRYGVYSVFTFF